MGITTENSPDLIDDSNSLNDNVLGITDFPNSQYGEMTDFPNSLYSGVTDFPDSRDSESNNFTFDIIEDPNSVPNANNYVDIEFTMDDAINPYTEDFSHDGKNINDPGPNPEMKKLYNEKSQFKKLKNTKLKNTKLKNKLNMKKAKMTKTFQY